MYYRLALGFISVSCGLLATGVTDVATPAFARLTEHGITIHGPEKENVLWEAVLQQIEFSEKRTLKDVQGLDFAKIFNDQGLRVASARQISNFYDQVPQVDQLARSFDEFVKHYPPPLTSCVHITAIYAYRERDARLLIEGGSSPAYIVLKEGRIISNVWQTRTPLEAKKLIEIPLVLVLPEKTASENCSTLVNASLEEREATARSYLNYYYLNAVGSLLRTVSSEGARLTYRFRPPAGWIKSGLIDFCVFAEAARLLGLDSATKALSCLYPRANRLQFMGAINPIKWDDTRSNLGLKSEEEADNYALDACGTFVDYSGRFGNKDLNRFLSGLSKESVTAPISTADALDKFKAVTGRTLADFSPYNPKFKKR